MSEMNNNIRRDADQNNKMRTYRKFKTIESYKCGDNLHQVIKTCHRITLTKLQLSNHKLTIDFLIPQVKQITGWHIYHCLAAPFLQTK